MATLGWASRSTSSAEPCTPIPGPVPAKPHCNIVVFHYQDKNCVVPRPASYEAAVALVRDYVVRYNQPISDIRLLARIPHLLADKDVEITPPAWDDASRDVTKFNIMIAPRLEESDPRSPVPDPLHRLDDQIQPDFSDTTLDSTSAPVATDLPLQPASAVNVIVMNLSGTPLCGLSLSPEETVHSVKTIIREKSNIPLKQQTLFHDDVTLQPTEQLSHYGIEDGDTLRLCRQSPCCKMCDCGPGSRAIVREEREMEDVLAEIRRKKALERDREREKWRVEEERREETEAQRIIERRRASGGSWL